MDRQVTLTVPQTIFDQAEKLGTLTKRNTEHVLADVLELMWFTLPEEPLSSFPLISSLPDQELLDLVQIKMDSKQNDRLGELQAKGKADSLNSMERYELMVLLQIYQIGQLRKAEAAVEAKHRNLL